MKKGITLVSLVITIIVLLILAGITLTIGDRGIISRAKQAGKNYLAAQEYEQEMLNNLDKEFENQLNGIGGDYNSSEQSSEFRKLVAQKITNEGVKTSEADTDQVILDNIGKILEAKTSDADAIADNISEGKVAYVQGQRIVGTYNSYNNLTLTSITTLNVYVSDTSQRPTYTISNTSQYKYLIFINPKAGGGGTSGTGIFYNFNCTILYNMNDSCFILSNLPSSVTFQYKPNYTGSNTCYIYGIV